VLRTVVPFPALRVYALIKSIHIAESLNNVQIQCLHHLRSFSVTQTEMNNMARKYGQCPEHGS